MRGQQNPIGYVKVFKESMVQWTKNTDFSQAIQNLDAKMCCYLVVQAATYPNQIIEMA